MDLARGEETGVHRHAMDYVLVVLERARTTGRRRCREILTELKD